MYTTLEFSFTCYKSTFESRKNTTVNAAIFVPSSQ